MQNEARVMRRRAAVESWPTMQNEARVMRRRAAVERVMRWHDA
jgi:hypothetical protein